MEKIKIWINNQITILITTISHLQTNSILDFLPKILINLEQGKIIIWISNNKCS